MDVEVEGELVRRAALDYFAGWYEADSARMDRALHDELVKRSFNAEGRGTLGRPLNKVQMVELTHGGGGSDRGSTSQQEIEVEVLDVYRSTASVVVRSKDYHEHLHLGRTSDGWKIVNAFWESTT